MKKIILVTIPIIIFVFVTAFILGLEQPKTMRTVVFSSVKMNIKNNNGQFIQQQNQVMSNSSIGLENKNVKINKDEFKIGSSETNADVSKFVFRNEPVSILDKNVVQKNGNIVNNTSVDFNNKKLEKREHYEYKNINWNKWHSNFVNKILDDSLAIKSLDEYPNGTALYYSFWVYSDGRISNISVKSFQIKDSDKNAFAEMIKGYEYEPITQFPRNSKRIKTKVSGIIMMADESSHATPSDFYDFENVKLKL